MIEENDPFENATVPFQEIATAVEEPPPEPEPFDLRTVEISFTALEKGRAAVYDKLDHKEKFRALVASMSTTGEEGRRRGLGLWMLANYGRCAEELRLMT